MDIEKLLTECKSSISARLDDSNKLIKNIANFGASVGQIGCVNRNGEYNGFAIEFLENVKPLLTNYKIYKAIKFLENTELDNAVNILNLKNEFYIFGEDIVHYVLYGWLQKAEYNIPTFINKIELDETNQNIIELNKYIRTVRSDPINYKIKIVNVGKSTSGNSVVPEDWLGKIFSSAAELHKQINCLDWRTGKPPCSYCCIYSMTLKEPNKWVSLDQLDITNVRTLIYFHQNQGALVTKLKSIDDLNEYNDNLFFVEKDFVLCISPKDINHNEKTIHISIGQLSSLLQKCFRRGIDTCSLFIKTIQNLMDAKSYTLPDLNFLNVSGMRQLLWRSFISIIEDVEPYEKNDDTYDLLDLFVLSLFCHYDTQISFNKEILDRLIITLCNVLDLDNVWEWRKGADQKHDFILTDDRTINSMLLALTYMPMMEGDKKMLNKSISYLKTISLPKLGTYPVNKLKLRSDHVIELETKMASIDMHCSPNILIIMQGIIDLGSHKTLKEIGSFIWTNSSRINVRSSKFNDQCKTKNDKKILRALYDIQTAHIDRDNYKIKNITHINFGNNPQEKLADNVLDDGVKRLGFIILFGSKFKIPGYEIIIAGTAEYPLKIKKPSTKNKYQYLNTLSKEYIKGENIFLEIFNKNKKIIKLPDPPVGYKWIFTKKDIEIKILKNDEQQFEFYADNIKVNTFDASSILIKLNELKVTCFEDQLFEQIIRQGLYEDIDVCKPYELIIVLREIHKLRNKLNNYTIYNWDDIHATPAKIWRFVYARIIMGPYVGPVDRQGGKLQNSINYYYEGSIWRILHVLSALYPRIICLKPNEFNFVLNKNYPEYNDMMSRIKECMNCITKFEDNDIIKPTIITKLWDHQQSTVNKLVDGYEYKKGFGDASHVGAGKTLCALATMINLQLIEGYCGFLVLLPGQQLFETWTAEIDKHTKGIEQYIE